MAEDEFDPIPVLITKNPQGKKERMGKKKSLTSALYKISNVPNLQGGEKASSFNEGNSGNDNHCELDQYS